MKTPIHFSFSNPHIKAVLSVARRRSTRTVRHHFAICLVLTAGIAFADWMRSGHASAAGNLHVININDSGPGSLRQAVLDANVSPADDEIDFAIPGCTASTPCSITLTNGELSLSANGSLTITGPGSSVLTVSGGGQNRVFHVLQSAVVSLSGLTVTGGLNSSVTVPLGSPLANGQSIAVEWLLGVRGGGSFRFNVNIDALP